MTNIRFVLVFVGILLLTSCATPAPTMEGSGSSRPTATVEVVEPTAVPTETETGDLASFLARLQTAIIEQNYAEIEAVTSDPIGVAGWRSEWRMYTPEQLIAEFQNATLPAPTDVQFTELSTEQMTLLIGQPPATMLGPATTVVAALHSSGWGATGMDEAILFVGEKNGRFSWAAFLYTSGSFDEATNDIFPVIETAVETIMANQDVIIYSGPGENYAEIGGIFDGQQALVTGQSPDGTWWRVICPDDTIGDCWVTADKTFTTPTSNP